MFLGDAALYAQFAPANPKWNRVVEPFRVVGNLYYVGASDVSAFLLTTPAGHFLIDTGFAETVPIIESSLGKLGFRMEDIRILLSSHAHADHAGGLAEVKSKSRARLLTNPTESAMFSRGGKGDFAFGDTFSFPPVEPDGALTDRDEISLGGVAVRVHFTPGHTRGCTSYTTTIQEELQTYDVVIPCSLTAPGYRLVDNPLYPTIIEDFESTFARLRGLPCDIFLGGHSWDFGLAEKSSVLSGGTAGNPFVDPVGYRRWLDDSEASIRVQIAAQRSTGSGSR
jgi:metallo-beta-lactamase class B